VTATLTEIVTGTPKKPSRPERLGPPPAGPLPSRDDSRPPKDRAQRPRDAWHERHPVLGLIAVMVLFAAGGLVVSALVLRCATLAVAFM
jgi:hypothetical protein